jgi:hypothetical protein
MDTLFEFEIGMDIFSHSTRFGGLLLISRFPLQPLKKQKAPSFKTIKKMSLKALLLRFEYEIQSTEVF